MGQGAQQFSTHLVNILLEVASYIRAYQISPVYGKANQVMPLCDLCNGITVTAHRYKHQPSFDALLESASQCGLCKLIAEVLQRNGNRKSAEEYRESRNGRLELVNDTSIVLSVSGHEESKEGASLPPYRLFVTCGPIMRHQDAKWRHYSYSAASGYGLSIYANEGTPAAESIPARPIPANPDSNCTYLMIQNWASICVEEHKECQLTVQEEKVPARITRSPQVTNISFEEDVPLPTRVLELSTEAEGRRVKLSQTRGQEGCYIALSHCWGNSQHLVTTKASLRERLANIAYTELPKTFQDAVTITERVGIRYLWIDSLCIIQDDQDDWEQESALMGQVYRNAYLTIAAAASVDGNGGCFLLRGPSDAQAIALSFHTPDGIPAGQWYIYDNPDNPSSSVMRSPLQMRAWTLQERHLSRRMVHFARDQIYFECKHSFKFENCRPEYKHGAEYLTNSIVYAIASDPTLRQNPIILSGLVARQWSAIVENYTGRKLTKAMDKLPALSGLASHLAQLTKQAYVAGLWKGSYFSHHQLMWRVPPYDEGVVSSRAKVWRAPSWSWASIDGPVLFSDTWAQPVEPKHDGRCLDDIQVNAEVLGRDPYGQVESGSLVVTGWTVAVELLGPVSKLTRWERSTVAEWGKWILRKYHYTAPHTALVGYDYTQAPDKSFFGAAAFDERVEGSGGLEALLVLRQIGADEFKQEGHADSFLVLFITPTEANEGTYRRVGMGHLVMNQELRLGIEDKKRVTIV